MVEFMSYSAINALFCTSIYTECVKTPPLTARQKRIAETKQQLASTESTATSKYTFPVEHENNK